MGMLDGLLQLLLYEPEDGDAGRGADCTATSRRRVFDHYWQLSVAIPSD